MYTASAEVLAEQERLNAAVLTLLAILPQGGATGVAFAANSPSQLYTCGKDQKVVGVDIRQQQVSAAKYLESLLISFVMLCLTLPFHLPSLFQDTVIVAEYVLICSCNPELWAGYAS